MSLLSFFIGLILVVIDLYFLNPAYPESRQLGIPFLDGIGLYGAIPLAVIGLVFAIKFKSKVGNSSYLLIALNLLLLFWFPLFMFFGTILEAIQHSNK
ncbi:hypothetical protein BIV60_15395 [Bacillus sp. MUM 116]|nr:hypothetical protein BIV60_15395 [Bacillus sp. MUM 116]